MVSPDEPGGGIPMEMLGGELAGLIATMADTLGPDRWEYARLPWEELNKAGSEGWELVPLEPVIPAAVPLYIMRRKITGADGVAAALHRGELGHADG